MVTVDDPVTPTRDSGGFVFRPTVNALPPEMEPSSLLEAPNPKPLDLAGFLVTLTIASLATIVVGLSLIST